MLFRSNRKAESGKAETNRRADFLFPISDFPLSDFPRSVSFQMLVFVRDCVAVSLSENGSESGSLHIFETATGRRRADVIPRVHGPTAGGSAAWRADGTGLFYTRYPRQGERAEADLSFYQQVYFHKLDTPTGPRPRPAWPAACSAGR